MAGDRGPSTWGGGWLAPSRVAVGGGHVGWRCWPGLFAWGPPSQGLWGTQRREWEPLNQHCAGHSGRRRPAGGGHMSGGGWVCLCVCPCAHMLTRGSFQAEVLWVKTVADLEVCAVTGGWNLVVAVALAINHRAWAGRKPSAPSV